MIQKVKLTTRKGKQVTGRRITITSDFETNIENIWNKILDIDTLREICKPKASFISSGNASLIWKEGKTFLFKIYLHTIIPIGKHSITVIKMDKTSREIDTNEYNKVITIWNHYIKMEEINQNRTRYTDTIDIYAGRLTSVTTWWSIKFYKHRQQKWKKIAKSL